MPLGYPKSPRGRPHSSPSEKSSESLSTLKMLCISVQGGEENGPHIVGQNAWRQGSSRQSHLARATIGPRLAPGKKRPIDKPKRGANRDDTAVQPRSFRVDEGSKKLTIFFAAAVARDRVPLQDCVGQQHLSGFGLQLARHLSATPPSPPLFCSPTIRHGRESLVPIILSPPIPSLSSGGPPPSNPPNEDDPISAPPWRIVQFPLRRASRGLEIHC